MRPNRVNSHPNYTIFYRQFVTNVRSKQNAVKKETELKQRSLSEMTVDGSQDSEQEKPHMRERKEGKKRVNLSVREVVSEYVHKSRWDTLVGKAFHMGSEESREEFVDFLTTHIDAMMKVGYKMRDGKQ